MKTDDLIKSLSGDCKEIEKIKHPARSCCSWLFAALLFVGLTTIFMGFRDDINNKLHSEMFVLEMISALAVGLLGALAANWLSIPDVNQQKWVVWLPFIPLTILTFLIGYEFYVQPLHLENTHSEKGILCAGDVLWLISLPALLLFVLLRKAATTHTRMSSFMAILAVCAFAYISARLVCPNDDLGHLLLWHYSPILFVSVVGAAIGYRVLKW